MGIWKVRTLPYHPQTNGQVEWVHQMLMGMFGKLGKDQKADWPKHLLQLVHAHNSMRSAITRYSPHYLMYGWVNTPACWLLFPHSCEHRKIPVHQSLHCWLMWVTVWSLKRSASAVLIWGWKAELHTTDHIASAVSLEGDLVLAKANAYKGRRKVKDQWEEEPCMKWNTRLQQVSLHTSWKTSGLDAHESSIRIDFFSSPLLMGAPLCTGVWAEWTRCCHHHPAGTHSESEWEWESITECKVSVATGPVSESRDSSRLCQQEAYCTLLEIVF